eukprot:scaffold67007_cov21-Prasinocladus_malaysianus.AAC.1
MKLHCYRHHDTASKSGICAKNRAGHAQSMSSTCNNFIIIDLETDFPAASWVLSIAFADTDATIHQVKFLGST